MKWIAGVCFIAIIVGAAASITVPAATVAVDREILKLFPQETVGIGVVDAAALRNAALVQPLLESHPAFDGDFARFVEATGFRPERDIDKVTIGRVSEREMLIVLEARYDRLKVEQFLRDKNISSETYQGWSIYRPDNGDKAVLALVDSVVFIGNDSAVRGAIERRAAPATSVLDNSAIMGAVNTIEAGNQIWAAGRFTFEQLPVPRRGPIAPMEELLRSLQGGTFQMRVDQDLHANAKGDFPDAEKTRNVVDTVRSLIELAKLQAGENQDFLKILEGIRVDASGATMIVNVDVPGELIQKLPLVPKLAH